MSNSRLASAKILQKILEEKIFFGDLKKQISEKDLPFCNMLILTVLRKLVGLKQVLNGFLSKKIPHKHRLAEYLLLSSMAEILFMETPEYAVINETVQNIRRTCDKFLGGLANAVLRKVCVQKDELRAKVNAVSPLPAEFAKIIDDYSADEKAQIAQSVDFIAPLDLTVKGNPREWAEKMQADLLPSGSLRLYNPPKIQQLPFYNSGEWWVQDAASALPAKVMGDIAGKKVIDLCAAPGGKIAQLAAAGAEVTALDISATRLETLKQNMARLNFNNVRAIAIDALEYLQKAEEQYEAILLDAPCSATGTFRRHPEILHIKSPKDVEEQAALQAKLLAECARILKVGGTLVYSVCSISKLEGEYQIEKFLKQNRQFKQVAICADEISAYGSWENNLLTANGAIRTLPYFQSQQKGMDSFFICKLQRII
jgi:16S rRNA (cytosine967-C5)-methyltransferase